jgi:hypothetical protein
MAAFSNQKTYVSKAWRKKLENIVGTGGVQWKVGTQAKGDPSPSTNSDFINDELMKAQASNGEYVVLLCNP